MIKAFLVFAALLLPALAGYAVIALIDAKNSLSTLERLPLSFGVGAGLLSTYMFIIGALGLSYSLPTLLPFFVAAAIILYAKRAYLLKEPCLPEFAGKRSLRGARLYIAAALVLLIVWKLYFATHSAIAYPTYFDDAASTWDYKAKVIYYDKGISGENSAEVFGGAGAGYPLSTPLFRAWICIVAGEWNDACAHMHSVAVFCSLLLLFFAFAGTSVSLFTAIVFTYILSAVPLLSYHSFANYAELPMAFYLLASAAALSRWFTTGSAAYLYVAGLSALIMAFTKNEGALLFTPILMAVFAGMLYFIRLSPAAKKKIIVPAAAAVACVLLPWLAVKFIHGFGLDILGISLQFHPEAFGEILSVLFTEGNFGIIFGAAVLLITLRPEMLRERTFLSCFIPAMLLLAGALFVFTFTSNYEWLRQRTAINRVILITIAPMILSFTILADSMLNGLSDKTEKNNFQ